ncbi:MAG TPA: hypothetical protein VIZ65_12805 [Cellvibrionaceae bacterium]
MKMRLQLIVTAAISTAILVVGMGVARMNLTVPKSAATPASSKEEEMTIRKLTLTLGQSSHTVKMHPALIDQINEEAFNNHVSAYMNQPFDFTYQQGLLSFNIPRTHTLSLYAEDEKLSAIGVEIYPIFENDFEAARAELVKWMEFFNALGLVKTADVYDVPLNELFEKFKQCRPDRECGFPNGGWLKDNTQVSVDMTRFERTIFNADTKEKITRPVYKVSINLKEKNNNEALPAWN